MKKMTLLAFGLSALSILPAQAALNTVDEKVSYTLGSDLATNLQQQGININVSALVQGIQDVIQNKPLQLTEEEMKQAIVEVKKTLVEKKKREQQQQAEINAKNGEAFLAQNKLAPGVKVLTNGLQYKVLESGQGNTPQADHLITANYEGRLINGTVFDSSYQRGTPIEFNMGDVIKGWGAALKLMKEGDVWEIYVPPSLGYGARGAGQVIGPNETLIFKIALIKTEKKGS